MPDRQQPPQNTPANTTEGTPEDSTAAPQLNRRWFMGGMASLDIDGL